MNAGHTQHRHVVARVDGATSCHGVTWRYTTVMMRCPCHTPSPAIVISRIYEYLFGHCYVGWHWRRVWLLSDKHYDNNVYYVERHAAVMSLPSRAVIYARQVVRQYHYHYEERRSLSYASLPPYRHCYGCWLVSYHVTRRRRHQYKAPP